MSIVYGGAKSDDYQFVERDEIYAPEGCYALWRPDLDGAGTRLREQLGFVPPGALSTDWLTANQINAEGGDTTGFTPYAGGGTTIESSTEQAHGGTRSIKVVTNSGTGNQGIRLGPATAVCPTAAAVGQKWYFSVWVFAPNGQAMRTILTERNTAGTSLSSDTTAFVGTGTWQQRVVTRTLISATVAELRWAIQNDGAASSITFYVDDFAVYRTDMTGNANAAITGAVWAAGPNGSVLRFDAVDDYAKIIGDPISVGARTVEALIKPTSGALTTPRILSNRECRLWIDWVAAANRIGFGRASATSIYSANGSIVSGAWQHVVASSDAAGATSLYVNGVLSGAAGQAGGTPAGGADTYIGNLAAATSPLGGDVALVRLYNRALTAGEVREAFYDVGPSVGLG